MMPFLQTGKIEAWSGKMALELEIGGLNSTLHLLTPGDRHVLSPGPVLLPYFMW